MKIGILQCGHLRDEIKAVHGDYFALYQRMLAGHGFSFGGWSVVDMDFPASVDDCDGWLLTGSRHGAYDDLPFIAPLEDFVRSAYAEAVPLAGICFGHQLIAQALGGKVEKFDAGWAMGRHAYAFDDIGEVALNAWNQDQVVEKPADATVVATSPFCRYAALAYGDRAYSVQPHPEFSNDFIADLLRVGRQNRLYPEAAMDKAAANLSEPPDNALMADRIAGFFLSHAPSAVARAHG
jgi:GMP synthase (glutamine-hydrolysing)